MSSEQPVWGESNAYQDLLLLFSMLLLIIAHPVLDEVPWGEVLLNLLTFVPLVLVALRLRRTSAGPWFSGLLLVAFGCGAASYFLPSPSRVLIALQWALLTLAFGVSVVALFAYLQAAQRVAARHLYAAGSIYLQLVLMFFALYTTISALAPDSFEKTSGGTTSQAVDLLYFSMVTLTTVGYGDIVPVRGIVRILAGLEATMGVMYVAITVAILVGGYRARTRS
jgi:hypothetical protein